MGRLRQGATQGRRDARAARPVHRAPRVCCSSGGRRRRPRCSAPRNAATPHGDSYPWIVKTTGAGQPLLLLLRGRRLRPVLPEVLLLLSLQRQAVPQRQRVGQTSGRKAGIGFTALDNGFATVDDPAAVQAICDRLGPDQIDALLRKWLARLPHPFTAADRGAGYRYDLSVLQAEFSLTQMLDRPVSGGCSSSRSSATTSTSAAPTRSALIFDRRLRAAGHAATPGPVPHPGDHRRGHPEPARRLQAHPHQAVPQGRAGAAHRDHHQRHPRLRDRETTDQSARAAGDRLHRQPSPAARPTTQPRPDHRHRRPVPPSPAPSPPPAASASPGCGSPTNAPTPCYPHCSCSGCHPNGFTNKTCAPHTAQLRGLDPCTVTAGQMTYDLRRLRKPGRSSPGSQDTHRYLVTDHGLDTAMFLTCVQDRVLRCGLAELATATPTPGRLRSAATAYRTAVENLTTAA